MPIAGVVSADGTVHINAGGKWIDQQKRDDYAVQKIVPLLPGQGTGLPWRIVMSSEDPDDPEHESSCRAMRKAAKAAGVGWVSPKFRKRGAA